MRILQPHELKYLSFPDERVIDMQFTADVLVI